MNDTQQKSGEHQPNGGLRLDPGPLNSLQELLGQALVVSQAYYAGIGEGFDQGFASAGLGWYYALGVQMPRMIYTGVSRRSCRASHRSAPSR